VLLIGGALLTHGGDLRASTAKFLDAVRAHCSERLDPPRREYPSACAGGGAAGPARHVPYREWSARAPGAYKESARLPFHGVARRELLGTPGFDVRYFEIEPGGYTSEEKHVHTHAIIGVRGRGVLSIGDERVEVAPNDIAYVPPLAVHQLRNETEDTPFGFYCIVDHERDAPRAP
jgi:ribulose-bisphosphate carboxylase large chain